ncbi:MAG TPA: N-acetylmuramoyl-L-alanine amidase [Anaerohalosphaeraceae bacterium]|nr:N-acetylmuramoyl-L-alanine amidase [Anaerohalosphaeraceae bacterium]HQG06365.1 N-acetylmuramoyl-L-alanine amidase [Anaerohalosphaeraceae bacterium]HQI07774.1 N-acetylmuramoyl-L-alanine amidase [Anaerohalosphaeraceae bacterium]HQJ68126.1 N-acetylmuramoyl-L-alanine amidase [Anaerohalosphaeraceae bacterium]
MPRIQRWLGGLLLLLLAFAGCQAPPKSTAPRAPSYMLSADDLAARLGLRVSFTGGRYVELSNSANRVVIFTHSGGSIYVNGENIGQTGTVIQEGQTVYVAELLVPRIRSYLKSAAPLPHPGYTPSPTRPLGGKTVVIDAGHGGKDPGATSYLGYYEKEVNLKVAQKVAWLLKKQGINVIMTRNNDSFIELNERAEIANHAGADLFVSIHHNSNHNRVHHGYTVYIAPNASDASRRAGRLMERALSTIGLSSNGLRTNDYRVLMRTQGPALLIECGYLSNPSEAAALYDIDFQNRLASAIAQAIVDAL